jgi:short-subunit dehydrogenase
VARRRGTLINLCSVLALAPERFNAVYSGTKPSMLNLSMALQTEPANTGIRVQSVLPGATRTGLWGKGRRRSRGDPGQKGYGRRRHGQCGARGF